MAATLRVSRAAWLFAWSGAAMFAASLAFFLYSYLVRFGRPAAGPGLLVPVAIDVGAVHALRPAPQPVRPSARQALAVRRRVRHGSDRVRASLWSGRPTSGSPACSSSRSAPPWQPVPGELYHVTGVVALAAYAVHAAGIVLTARGSARLDVLDLAGVRAVVAARRCRPRAAADARRLRLRPPPASTSPGC